MSTDTTTGFRGSRARKATSRTIQGSLIALALLFAATSAAGASTLDGVVVAERTPSVERPTSTSTVPAPRERSSSATDFEPARERPDDVVGGVDTLTVFDPAHAVTVRTCGPLSTVPLVRGSETRGAIDAFGDGTDDDDILVFYNGQWRVRLRPSAGEHSEVTLPDTGLAGAQTLGSFDIGNGGGEEFLAVVQTGTEAVVVGVFGVDEDGCLFRYEYESGYPVILPIRNTWHLREGLVCASGLFHVRAERQGSEAFRLTSTQLVAAGAGVAEWANGAPQTSNGEDHVPELGLYCHDYYVRDDIEVH